MKKVLMVFTIFVFASVVFAGPPPDAGGGVPGVTPVQIVKRWFGLEYGWYGPSLKSLNRTFSGVLGGEKIGTNDYLALGIGMPVPEDNRIGFFFAYWNGGVKQGPVSLNLNMICFSPEGSFRIVKIKDMVHFSLGFIIRDVFSWWKFEDLSESPDSSGISIVTDFGGKITAEYYPIKSFSLKCDFGRVFWGFDYGSLVEEEEHIKVETHGNILKFGLNLYY